MPVCADSNRPKSTSTKHSRSWRLIPEMFFLTLKMWKKHICWFPCWKMSWKCVKRTESNGSHGFNQLKHSELYLELLRMVGKNTKYEPNGDWVVIYHGRKPKITFNKSKPELIGIGQLSGRVKRAIYVSKIHPDKVIGFAMNVPYV